MVERQAVALARLVLGQRDQHLAGPEVTDGACRRPTADVLQGLAQTQRHQRLAGVGRDAEPRADLAELGHLLEHPHPLACAQKPKRRGEPADAGADDDDVRGLHGASRAARSRPADGNSGWPLSPYRMSSSANDSRSSS